ncbi:MAG TPA: GNAT family N-acetyltransferase [Propionibacteriaceae bacterium]
MSTPTPPHLAEPVLTVVTPERLDDYLGAVMRGFHERYEADLWEPIRAVTDPARNFGFVVDDQWITTCGAFERVLTVPGGEVPVAAVTYVTVNPAYRRRGLLRQMMTHQLEEVAERGVEPVALLWASEAPIYGRFGYGDTGPKTRMSGDTRALGFLPGVDLGHGSVGEVTREAYVEIAPVLHRRWLPDRPGALDRDERWWARLLHDPETWRDGASPLRYAVHFTLAGEPDGYLTFRVKEGIETEVQVHDLDADGPVAYAALWRFLLDLDLVRRFVWESAPYDDPLLYLVADRRAVKTELAEGTYARLVDVPRALAARHYATELDVVLEIADAMFPSNHGTFRFQAGPDGASLTRTAELPDLSLDARELGAIYLGGVSLGSLHRAGRVREHTPGAVRTVGAAFVSERQPTCPDHF